MQVIENPDFDENSMSKSSRSISSEDDSKQMR